MLRRQRIVLALLNETGGLDATGLHKRLFLLRRETPLAADAAFYDFVPYRFGPYSFQAAREIEALREHGYLAAAGRMLRPTASGARETRLLTADASRGVRAIVRRYQHTSSEALMRDVYRRYPWFAQNTERPDLAPQRPKKRGPASPAVYTVGYERRSVDAFLNGLIENGIRMVIDVRANPISRKYGFAGGTLARLVRALGVGYVHHPKLGIPSSHRRAAEAEDNFPRLFRYYERRILSTADEDIGTVAEVVRSRPAALLCREAAAADCHRSRLAAKIAGMTGLPVVNL